VNYYSHHIGDYRRDTAHLTLLEHGIYRQLLDWYYLDQKPIPKETQVVIRRLSAKTQEEIVAVGTVLNDFFSLSNGWHHKRCDMEIRGYEENATKNRANGKLGGRPRKTQVVSFGIANDNPNESETKGNHKPLTINQEPLTNINTEPNGSLSSTRTPSQQLLSVFHEKCGLLPKVSIFSDKRKGTLKSRFTEVMKTENWEPDQTVAWFADFYEKVNISKFLTGRAAPGRDGRSFKADWDWVHSPVNFVKIIEGKYDNGL